MLANVTTAILNQTENMQRCPKCNRIYTEGTFTFCLDDGALLSAPDNHEETETVIISKPPIPEPAPTALTSQIAQKSNKLFWIVGSAAILVFGTALILYLQTTESRTHFGKLLSRSAYIL